MHQHCTYEPCPSWKFHTFNAVKHDYSMEYVRFLTRTATHVRTLAYMWQSWLESNIIPPVSIVSVCSKCYVYQYGWKAREPHPQLKWRNGSCDLRIMSDFNLGLRYPPWHLLRRVTRLFRLVPIILLNCHSIPKVIDFYFIQRSSALYTQSHQSF